MNLSIPRRFPLPWSHASRLESSQQLPGRNNTTVAESIRVRFSEFVLPHFSPAETASAPLFAVLFFVEEWCYLMSTETDAGSIIPWLGLEWKQRFLSLARRPLSRQIPSKDFGQILLYPLFARIRFELDIFSPTFQWNQLQQCYSWALPELETAWRILKERELLPWPLDICVGTDVDDDNAVKLWRLFFWLERSKGLDTFESKPASAQRNVSTLGNLSLRHKFSRCSAICRRLLPLRSTACAPAPFVHSSATKVLHGPWPCTVSHAGAVGSLPVLSQ